MPCLQRQATGQQYSKESIGRPNDNNKHQAHTKQFTKAKPQRATREQQQGRWPANNQQRSRLKIPEAARTTAMKPSRYAKEKRQTYELRMST